MKTLEEIINREDYKTLNEALKDRAIELAEKLKTLCFELDLEACDSFRLADITFQLRKVKTNSGFSQWNLYMYTERGFVAIDERSSYYYVNDFNCWIKASNNSEKLYFLNHAKTIFTEIDEEINAKCNAIESALKDVENL